jgi:hypothetical protein
MSYLEIATAGTGVARDAHYVIPTGGTLPIRTLLLEPQRTNLCIRSEEFDTWTDVNTCNVSADAIAAPDGATTADLLTATVTASSRRRDVTFTADGEKCVAVYLKQGTAAANRVLLFDTTAATNRHLVTVTWTAGVPALSTASGAGTLYPVESLTNSWYRILFSATGVVAANTNNVRVFPDPLGAGTGTVYAWGAQAENAVVPSSYIPTAAATVTRNADSLYFPFTAPPQAMTVYVRFCVQDSANVAPSTTSRIVHIGAQTQTTDASLALFRSTSAAGYRFLHDPATLTQTGSVGTTAIRGNVVELRGVLSAAGAPQIGASINGGAEGVSAVATAQALAADWADARLWLAGTTGHTESAAFTHVVVAQGEQTMATMRQLAGVA